MRELTEKCVPAVSIQSKQSAPLFTNSIKKEISRKKRLFTKAKARNDQPTWQACQSAVKKLSKTIRAAKQNVFEIPLTNVLKNNPKQFWKAVNPSPPTPIRLYDDKDTELTDSDSAITLNMTFSSVLTAEARMNPSFSSQLVIAEPMPPISITPSGVLNIIDKMQLSSATGPDEINSQIRKNVKLPVSVMLALLFAESLWSSCIPVNGS